MKHPVECYVNDDPRFKGHDCMRTQCYRYLTSLGVTLWPGVSFDITDPKERARAAEWLSDSMEAMQEVGRGVQP